VYDNQSINKSIMKHLVA